MSAAHVLRLAETLEGLSKEFHGLRFLGAEVAPLRAAARELEALRAENNRLRLEKAGATPAEATTNLG